MLNKFDAKFLKVGVIALTLVASTQAFARGEGGGGGGGGGEGGAGEVGMAVAPPQTTPETPPPTIRGSRGRQTIVLDNCQLWMKSMRYC